MAKIPRLGEGRQWRIGSTAVLTAAVLITVGVQISMFADVGGRRELGAVSMDGRAADFHQARGNRWLAAHYDGVGAGSLSCWETHPVLMSSKLRGDLDAEEYLADPRTGTATRVSWSPNEIVVKVKTNPSAALGTGHAARLLVNQNWHPGWRSGVGTVVSDDGLLAVDLPPGQTDYVVTLSFRPMSATTGFAVTGAALLSLIVLALQRRGFLFRRGVLARTVGLVLLPWGVFAGCLAMWSEPKYPPPPLRNANGSPALVSEVAPDAAMIKTQFDIPIVVDAVKFEQPNPLGNIGVDLWLRRTGPVARTTGMFVHLIRRGENGEDPMEESKIEKDKEKPKDFYNSDHQVVGGSFYISDAPEGYLVHDAFGVHMGKAARGQWDVWLGFGHVSGRRGRAKIVQTEGRDSKVHEDRVRIGTFFVR